MKGSSEDSGPKSFSVSPESMDSLPSTVIAAIPKFKITGSLHRSAFPISMPFTGEVTVEESDMSVKSIELQLIRIESIDRSDGFSSPLREATEVQNVQVGDGDICRGLPIPLYFIFPRIFCCPTVKTGSFKIEFEVNLNIIFEEGYQITENFPITIVR